MVPFYDFYLTVSGLQSHFEKTVYEETCLTTKSPIGPDTHLGNLGRMKGCVSRPWSLPVGLNCGAWITGLGIQHPNH